MKFLFSLTVITISLVTLLYYLLNNSNFLPTDSLGNYNWINIGSLVLLSSLLLVVLLNLLIYSLITLKVRESSNRERIIFSVKYSIIISTGIYIVLLLNFFHVLDWIWGSAILLVVLLSLFII